MEDPRAGQYTAMASLHIDGLKVGYCYVNRENWNNREGPGLALLFPTGSAAWVLWRKRDSWA